METIYNRITAVAGDGTDLSSIPSFLFFRIFFLEMKMITNICANAGIPDRTAEFVTFEMQLNQDSETERNLYELLYVEASRRMIEAKLEGKNFDRTEDCQDGKTFMNPQFRTLENFKIKVTLYKTAFMRVQP